jgi:uncharacterized protein
VRAENARFEPGALGLGLRPAFQEELLLRRPALGFVEIITENYLNPHGMARKNLARVRGFYPVVAHGVSLNLLGTDELDEAYLDALKQLIDEFEIPYATDHLSWTSHRGAQHHDLLPAPFTRDLVGYAAERAAYVQERIGVPLGLENVSSYVEFGRTELDEWEFGAQVAHEADCGLLLDVNNVFVNSVNHGYSPEQFLAGVPWERVLQLHIAGHQVLPNGLLHDTHDAPLADAVWSIYRRALELGGPMPTLLEWDAQIPPLDTLLSVLQEARAQRGTP